VLILSGYSFINLTLVNLIYSIIYIVYCFGIYSRGLIRILRYISEFCINFILFLKNGFLKNIFARSFGVEGDSRLILFHESFVWQLEDLYEEDRMRMRRQVYHALTKGEIKFLLEELDYLADDLFSSIDRNRKSEKNKNKENRSRTNKGSEYIDIDLDEYGKFELLEYGMSLEDGNEDDKDYRYFKHLHVLKNFFYLFSLQQVIKFVKESNFTNVNVYYGLFLQTYLISSSISRFFIFLVNILVFKWSRLKLR
jgi:hypothetical protein